jgi:hypothetical protein
MTGEEALPAETATPPDEPESWLAEQVRLLALEEGLGP